MEKQGNGVIADNIDPIITGEVLMRNLLASVALAVTLCCMGASISAAGPHGCYSSHCGKH
jgi:hypothetical protein